MKQILIHIFFTNKMIKSILLLLSISQIFSRIPSLNFSDFKEFLENINKKQSNQMNFLQDFTYDHKEDQNLPFEQIVIRNG